MKKIIIPIIIVIAIGIIGYIFYSKQEIEEEVKKYVNDNYQELTTIADSYMRNNEVTYPDYIKKVTLYKGIYTDIVEFQVKDNYGFYFSSKNYPAAKENIDTDLLELGGEKYTWDEENNKGTTIKIRDYWYFYKLNK